MTSPAYSILFEVTVSGVTGSGSPGDVLILKSDGSSYVQATTANRGSRRSTGIALTAYANNSTVEIQQQGQVSAGIATTLGAGTASWVRVSATGTLERCTPSGSDDVCGWVEADGTFRAFFGLLTAAIVNGSGGGGATLPIDLAGGAGTVINQLPAANQAAQTMAGDVTGTTAASVVAKANGATVPAAGALTTGNVLQATGASALGYAPVNLAGGANFVTGTLPAANQASQTLAGDVTGTTAASVVAKVNGATVPAAGALTTGNVLQVSGVGALSYGPLNLAGGSNFISNSLPVTNGGTGASTFGLGVLHANGTSAFTSSLIVNADVSGSAAIAASKVVQATGTGFPHVTAGALDAASIKVDTTNSAHVTVPGTTDGVVTTNGSVLQQAANVLAGSSYVSIGATPSTTGALRFANATSCRGRDVGNTSDRVIFETDSSNEIFVGTDPGFTTTQWGFMRVAASQITLGTTVNQDMFFSGSTIAIGLPVIGHSAATSPYSVHGKTTVATTGSFTVAAADYKYDAIMFSSAAGGTVTFPLPASDAAAYYKTIIYSGNGTLVVTNGGGAPKNVSLSTNTTVRCLFDTVGVHPVSTAAAYP